MTETHKKTYCQMKHLLEKMYYEPDRPSALGGVNKFYRATRRFGVKRSQVLVGSNNNRVMLYTDLRENTFAATKK